MATGWGKKTWGAEAWGDLSDTSVNLSGLSLSLSIGTVQETINADATVTVTNVGQMAFGEPTAVGGTSALIIPTGQEITITGGEEVIGIGVELTSSNLQATTSIGTATIDDSQLTGAGWGRRTWGNLAWGDAYSAIAVGQQLTSTINFPAANAFTDVNVSVSGVQINSTFASPSFSIQIDQDIFVLASEDQLDFTIGSSTLSADANVTATGVQSTMSVGTAVGGLKTPVDVSGIQATMTLGSITLIQSTNESVTGQQLTASLGQHAEIPGQIIGVGGLQLAGSIGSVSVTGLANIDVTGIQMTISAGNANVTAWAEVNTGVSNTWTVVDLAA
jgi:hypothetical protein